MLVSLLRDSLGHLEAVFWDDDFMPGKRWLEQFRGAIRNSPKLYVIWCAHSAASEYVQREYRFAIRLKKRVVPVLVDGTPLPRALSAIQGIDLRGLLRHRAVKINMRKSGLESHQTRRRFLEEWVSGFRRPSAGRVVKLDEIVGFAERRYRLTAQQRDELYSALHDLFREHGEEWRLYGNEREDSPLWHYAIHGLFSGDWAMREWMNPPPSLENATGREYRFAFSDAGAVVERFRPYLTSDT